MTKANFFFFLQEHLKSGGKKIESEAYEKRPFRLRSDTRRKKKTILVPIMWIKQNAAHSVPRVCMNIVFFMFQLFPMSKKGGFVAFGGRTSSLFLSVMYTNTTLFTCP